MNPIVQQLITLLTELLTTGSATYTSPAENFEVAGMKFEAQETVTLKKTA